jgi:hypothetical protein
MITVQPAQNIKDGIQNLINASIEDYNIGTKLESMKEEFANSWVVKEGPKYIKIIRKGSVHAFIVKKDFKHFKSGDVLKPASWAAPALNSPRGNVLEGNYPMCWTGPLYLN